MSVTSPRTRYVDVEASVRHNTGAAAVAAGLLIFFGFIFPFARHQGPGMYAAGESLLFLALRLGGLLMAGITIWLSFGHLPALAVDAVISAIIGLLIVVAGVLMVLDGGWWLQSLIISVSGATFFTSGLRDFGEYLELYRVDNAADEDEEDEIAVLATPKDSLLAEEVRKRREAPAPLEPAPGDPGLVEIEPKQKSRKTRGRAADAPINLDAPASQTPPKAGDSRIHGSSDSYLANLARKEKRIDR